MNWLRRVTSIIALLTLTLWISTYFVHIWLQCDRWVLNTNRYGIMFGNAGHSRAQPPNLKIDPALGSFWPTDDFLIDNLSSSNDSSIYFTAVMRPLPHWLLNLVAWSIVAFLWYRSRSFLPGQCQHCTYNLTGNESGTCPECGTLTKEMDAENRCQEHAIEP